MKSAWRKTAGTALVIPVIVTMLFACLPVLAGDVLAADTPIATMNGKDYWDFGDLADDLDDKGGECVRIEMLRDWDFKDNKKVKQRLFVPKNCNLTLNMNGHMFNRRLTADDDYTTNGELFLLAFNANVTINGGDDTLSHTVNVHTSTNRKKYATKEETVYGGTLSGGSSTNGAGCFHMRCGSILTLNNVTIAGCRAEQRAGTDGYGGAIAYNYGSCTLSGDTKSAITGNKAAGYGGGIWVDSGDVNISGLKIDRNDGTGEYGQDGQGGGYESEWASNCTLGAGTEAEGKDGEAKGFSEAADQVVKEVDYYIKKYELEDEIKAGNVVFWVAGFSRAGATANITSKRLVEKYADGSGSEGKGNRVFGYTCEAAKGGTDKAQALGDSPAYFCIHNMINTADVVPLVAPWQMGFKRYGVDHYTPGTTAKATPMKTEREVKHAGSSGITQVTTYADNEPVQTKTTDYDNLRDGRTSANYFSLQQNLSAIDSDMVFDDYFHPMAMNFFPSPEMYENGNYDRNRVEDFLEDFFRAAQEGLPEDDKEWSIAMGSRKVWAEDKTKINGVNYPTVQEAMRDTMSMVFTMSDEQSQSFIEKASTITDYIDRISFDTCMLDVYLYVIGDWYERTDLGKETYIKFFWDKLKETGALEKLDPDDAAKLEQNWPTMANFIFRLIDNDYNYKPGKHTDISKWAKGMTKSMTYIPTFATYSGYILSNHYPETNIAWTRMEDEWYMNEGMRKDLTEYEIIPPGSVNRPGAYIKEGTKQKRLVLSDGSMIGGDESIEAVATVTKDGKTINRLVGDQRIILENRQIVGEAVYYDLEDITSGEESGRMLEQDQIYRGGVDLTLGAEGKKAYKITTYDMSYGVKSYKAVYYINLVDGKHEVTVNDKIDEGEETGKDRTRTFRYAEGDEVRISAGIPSDKRFTTWTVTTVIDGQDRDVTDQIFAGDYAEYKTNANAAFLMPIPDDQNGFSPDYTLTFTAGYGDKISHITLTVDAPVIGTDLDTDASVAFNTIEGKIFSYPVMWTYTKDGKDYAASGPALPNTTYKAWLTMPQEEKCPERSDVPEAIAFAEHVTYTEPSGATGSGSRHLADGSVQIVLVYTTGEGPQPEPPATVKLTIKAYDQNIKQCLAGEEVEYNVDKGSTITVSAKSVTDELFNQWNVLYYDKESEEWIDSGVRIDDGTSEGGKTSEDRTVKLRIPQTEAKELIIQAEYRPLVSSISVEVPAPVGGEEMVTQVTSMIVHISNDYTVDPECTQITWNPAPKTSETGKPVADFEVPYTATVTLKPYPAGHEHEGTIKVTDKNDPSKVYYIPPNVFLYAENAIATMNGEAAVLDRSANVVIYTFPETGYELAADAESPDDASGIPRGAGLNAYIPDTIKVLRNDGMEVDAAVNWGEPSKADPEADPRSETLWTVSGTVALPENMDNPKGYSLDVSMNLTVVSAGAAASPDASLPSGTYLADQEITLSTDTDHGTIWYTLDGSDPTDADNPHRAQYDGTPIPIELGPESREVDLRAYTERAGLWDSIVSTYIYEFTGEVNVPAGIDSTYNAEPQIGVEGSPFYTLSAEEGSGVTIDEEGNAVATNAGTYTVTAKIKPDYTWIIENDDPATDEDESRTTTDDQTITFTIDPAQISGAVRITAEGSFKTLDDLKKALRVEPTGELKPVEGKDYEITYGGVKDGKVTVTVTGKGNYTGAIAATFIIDGDTPVKTKYTITFDLNGGHLDGRSGVISEEYYEGDVITMPGPARKGYTFRYWKGSRYEAGQKYTVTEDHTFTAYFSGRSRMSSISTPSRRVSLMKVSTSGMRSPCSQRWTVCRVTPMRWAISCRERPRCSRIISRRLPSTSLPE